MNLKTSNLEIKVVDNPTDQLKAFLVRAIVYMHEQNCPYAEEFDLNDFTCTQIVGLIDGEPVLTARIRFFGAFAKLERLAVRPQYRKKGFGHNLLTYMLEFVRNKGYRKAYLHAQSRLQSFYEEYGFQKIGQTFEFSDYSYIEMVAYLEPKATAVQLGLEPMIINRPEANLESPGPIETRETIVARDVLHDFDMSWEVSS